MRHAKRPRHRRLLVASVTVLVVALAVQVGRTVACADEIGRAFFYEPASPLGNCSLPDPGPLFASVSTDEYAGSAACGGYLDITGPRGSVRVQVVDRCPGCRRGELDLSRAAFARIGDLRAGVVPVAYGRVRNPWVPAPLAFRVKAGSSADWLAVQVVDHGNPLRAVRIRDGAQWRDLRRGADNYWVLGEGPAPDPFTVRVTDVYGNQVTATDLALAPGRLQRTTHRLYDEVSVTPLTHRALPSPRSTPAIC
ncbi:expansin EXLX1 family cellulose-binding protein [Acrocarpospora catenulata]|uniref:expansin EXLX1 family cellulose-binding protein n=1 Tax=Acrocarpospora catenulata TaxID=2836182 RepID=UPI001BDAB6B9|nr:expansin EXLX1 family cellulose-binding protein [Acrocarpospora catenulata]